MKTKVSVHTRRHARLLAPLHKREEQRAIQAAVERFTAELPDGQEVRYRVLGAELLVEKPEVPSKLPKRFIEVLIVDYPGRRNLQFLVQERGQVARVATIRGQPTFHEEEIQEARRIAGSDPRVAAVRRHRGLFVSAHAPPRPSETGGRVVQLHYVLAVKQRYEIAASVLVDLSDRRLLSVDVAGQREG
jgi:hypothetical protein